MTMRPRRPMPKFKHLRPAPPDSPIYTRGFRVGVTVFGKKEPASPAAPKASENAPAVPVAFPGH